jgi:serine/threonine protein kinase
MLSDPFDLVGSKLSGRYIVEAVVGQGGFSVVYRARHALWDRPVAIKAFRGLEGLDAESRGKMLRAFVQEGAMLAELSERTTAIVQARDMATSVTAAGDWFPYLVLEWLDGESLESVLWRERQAAAPPRSLEQGVALLEATAQALSLAHSKGICHRDLKPGNIFVLGDARRAECTTKLLDFGVATFFSDMRRPAAHARLSTDSYAFTPSYGAPEQFFEVHGPTGPWTDVFALALILVELVCGCEPMGEGSSDDLSRVAVDRARRPTFRAWGVEVPDAVERVVARALAVDAKDRWPTVGSFWRALHGAMLESSAEDTTPVPATTSRRRSRARHLPRATIVLAVVFAAAATTLSDISWPSVSVSAGSASAGGKP